MIRFPQNGLPVRTPVLMAVAVALALAAVATPALAAARFPKPDFETGHEVPTMVNPEPSAQVGRAYVDVALLGAALCLAAWLVHWRRSRSAIFALMIACLLYFGFYRKGCICAVGSIQNVAYALFHSAYAVPLYVVPIFSLPLVFALFFGRVFCAAVCPLGAVQDAVVVKNPVVVPRWLDAGLGLLPFIYLGLAVLMAATGAGFIICRYDPFVAFFRRGGTVGMLIAGGALLVFGVMVARPYCRFLCPYGVLLDLTARFSRRRLSVTPSECVKCSLCRDACPFDAIDLPSESVPGEGIPKARRRLAWLVVLLPVLVAGGAWMGRHLSDSLARSHPDVQLAGYLSADPASLDTVAAERAEAFAANGGDPEELDSRAADVRARFRTGSAWLGAFLALVVSLRLIGLSVFRQREIYEPDQGRCLACGRCYSYCPVGREEETNGPDLPET